MQRPGSSLTSKHFDPATLYSWEVGKIGRLTIRNIRAEDFWILSPLRRTGLGAVVPRLSSRQQDRQIALFVPLAADLQRLSEPVGQVIEHETHG